MSKLTAPQLRDLLLPGLWAIKSDAECPEHIDLDFVVEGESLLVKAYSRKTTAAFGFCITSAEIADGLYKETFQVSLKTLIAAVEQASPGLEKEQADG